MANFLIHLHQDGGCDYTIGCGDSIYTIEAKDIDAARAEAKQSIEDHGRSEIQYVTIYEVIYSETPNIDDLFASDDAKYAADAKAKEEAKERKILEDLKKKYPDA